jgi:hypothetical protein
MTRQPSFELELHGLLQNPFRLRALSSLRTQGSPTLVGQPWAALQNAFSVQASASLISGASLRTNALRVRARPGSLLSRPGHQIRAASEPKNLGEELRGVARAA